jgi:hypothetical protein
MFSNLQVDGVQRLAAQMQALAAKRSAQEKQQQQQAARNAAAPGDPNTAYTNPSNRGSSKGFGSSSRGHFSHPLWPPPLASPAVTQSIATTAQILQWIASEMSGLSQKERRVALNMPVDLAGKLTSRAAARAVKLLASAETDMTKLSGQAQARQGSEAAVSAVR